MYCPDCGKKMNETKTETLDRGPYSETVTNYQCTDCGNEWEFSFDTLNQERVLRAI